MKKIAKLSWKLPKILTTFDRQKVIRIAFALSVIYLIACILYPFIALRKINLPKITQEVASQEKVEPKDETKPFEFYSQGLKDKQIFSRVSQEGAAQMPVSGANVDIMKDINLVGIITGDNPQAIIEDKKTQKSYYVSKGQSVGEFQVEDIQEGRIILNYMGQKFELSL